MLGARDLFFRLSPISLPLASLCLFQGECPILSYLSDPTSPETYDLGVKNTHNNFQCRDGNDTNIGRKTYSYLYDLNPLPH